MRSCHRFRKCAIGRPQKHGSAGGLESFHSGDRIQKVADSGTQSAGFVRTEGRYDNILLPDSGNPGSVCTGSKEQEE